MFFLELLSSDILFSRLTMVVLKTISTHDRGYSETNVPHWVWHAELPVEVWVRIHTFWSCCLFEMLLMMKKQSKIRCEVPARYLISLNRSRWKTQMWGLEIWFLNKLHRWSREASLFWGSHFKFMRYLLTVSSLNLKKMQWKAKLSWTTKRNWLAKERCQKLFKKSVSIVSLIYSPIIQKLVTECRPTAGLCTKPGGYSVERKQIVSLPSWSLKSNWGAVLICTSRRQMTNCTRDMC